MHEYKDITTIFTYMKTIMNWTQGWKKVYVETTEIIVKKTSGEWNMFLNKLKVHPYVPCNCSLHHFYGVCSH